MGATIGRLSAHATWNAPFVFVRFVEADEVVEGDPVALVEADVAAALPFRRSAFRCVDKDVNVSHCKTKRVLLGVPRSLPAFASSSHLS